MTTTFGGVMFGDIAYEAYRQVADGKSLVTGALLPVWDELPERIREAWESAAEAVRTAEQARSV